MSWRALLVLAVALFTGPLWGAAHVPASAPAAVEEPLPPAVPGAVPRSDTPYTVDQLINLTKAMNFDVRVNAERVYQARQRIKLALSRLIPRLNSSAIVGVITQYYFDIAAALFGFLFPSNWFRWKESKLFFEAERRGQAALIANQVNTTYSLYYQVSYIHYLRETFDYVIAKIDSLVEVAKKRRENGEDKIDLLLRMQNAKLLMEQDRRDITNTLEKLHYDIGYAMAEPTQNWRSFSIEKAVLPDLASIEPIAPEPLLAKAHDVSFEVKQLEFLYKAAKYGMFARIFDFANPFYAEDANFLGAGTASNLRIEKSQRREIALQQEQMRYNINLALFKAVQDRNFAIKSFQEYQLGLQRVEALFGFLTEQFRQGGDYNIQDFVDVIQSTLMFKSQLFAFTHKFLISQSVIQRLLLDGPQYDNLLALTPNKTRKKPGIRRAIENMRIENAEKRGKL